MRGLPFSLHLTYSFSNTHKTVCLDDYRFVETYSNANTDSLTHPQNVYVYTIYFDIVIHYDIRFSVFILFMALVMII